MVFLANRKYDKQRVLIQIKKDALYHKVFHTSGIRLVICVYSSLSLKGINVYKKRMFTKANVEWALLFLRLCSWCLQKTSRKLAWTKGWTPNNADGTRSISKQQHWHQQPVRGEKLQIKGKYCLYMVSTATFFSCMKGDWKTFGFCQSLSQDDCQNNLWKHFLKWYSKNHIYLKNIYIKQSFPHWVYL